MKGFERFRPIFVISQKKLCKKIKPKLNPDHNQSTTLIELNPNIVDTLIGEFELESNREVCKRAWLNGLELTDRFI